MRGAKLLIKCGYSRLSCIKIGEFIKKMGGKSVFRFLSTKQVFIRHTVYENKGVLLCREKYLRTHISLGALTLSKGRGFSVKERFILMLSGGIIGILNGFFGGGGGMICVPILERVLNLDSKHAHATAIAVIFPLSLISAMIYVIEGHIQTLPLITIGLGVVAGGILGAFALKVLPPKVVRVLFALIMFAGGIKLIL